jgi:hypothetical protein
VPAFSLDAAGNLQQTPGRPAFVRASRAGDWLGHSLFVDFLRYHLEIVAVSYPGILAALEAVGMTPALPRTPGIVAGWYGPQWEARWRLTADLLEHLIGMLRAIREPPELFIAFVPSPFQVHESFHAPSPPARRAMSATQPSRLIPIGRSACWKH